MVWKCDFFWWFMRLVRVPPYESWANWTNFLGSWENGKFFWGQTCCTLLHTQNEEKSQKISTCIRIHTRVYANTWWWGQICPPPALIGLTVTKSCECNSPFPFLCREWVIEVGNQIGNELSKLGQKLISNIFKVSSPLKCWRRNT